MEYFEFWELLVFNDKDKSLDILVITLWEGIFVPLFFVFILNLFSFILLLFNSLGEENFILLLLLLLILSSFITSLNCLLIFWLLLSLISSSA